MFYTKKQSLVLKMLLPLCFLIQVIQVQGQTQEPFVTTWEVATDDLSITIPTRGDLTYNYTVDWGDGTTDTTTYTGDATHTYSAADTYTVKISSGFPAIYFNNLSPQAGDNSLKIKTIQSWGTQSWLTLAYAFRGCENLTTIEDGAGEPDLTMVTDISYMFSGATNFTSDLSSWDVSNVINMRRTFSSTVRFNGDISTWNVSNVTNMRRTFSRASSFTGDLSSWNVSKATRMDHMFFKATNFNGNLSAWDISNVTNMNNMFKNATSFSTENYDALLTGWSALTPQRDVVFGAPPTTYCKKAERDILTDTYNWDISGDMEHSCPVIPVEPFETTWDTQIGDDPDNTEITLPIIGSEGAYDVDVSSDGHNFIPYSKNVMKDALKIDFMNKYPLEGPGIYFIRVRPSADNTTHQLQINFGNLSRDEAQKLLKIDKWGDIVWTSMEDAFRECINMTIADGAGVPNLTEVANMQSMFYNTQKLEGDLSKWNVSNVTNMRNTFFYTFKFNSDLSEWNVSNVTNMRKTFLGALIFTSDLSKWNVSNVIDMRQTFQYAKRFNSDLSDWNVSKVTNMRGTFDEAFNFNGNLSSWNVSNVTIMEHMFRNAKIFSQDISDWNVSQVTDMNQMFTNATSFSSENYDALLTGWSELTLQDGVVFGAPPTTYCAGKAGRKKLTDPVADDGYNWNITGDLGLECSDLALSIKAFLQGPYDTSSNMMSDGLRAADIIPTTSPYSPYGDGATIGDNVLSVTGTDAIVDWVEISLHDPNDVSIVITTVPALIQRDGDVVALDGSSILQIQGIAGDYKVSINHRNHIPVITDAVQSLSTDTTTIDFTKLFLNDSNGMPTNMLAVRGGSNAMAEVKTGVYALFSGDVDGDGQVQSDDYNAVLQDIGKGGYLTSDINMNGEIQADDRNLVFRTFGKGKQF